MRRVVPGAAALELRGHDYERGGKPVIAWDDSDVKNVLVCGLVSDARGLLDAVDQAAFEGEAPMRSDCWVWSPVKMSSPATPTARGGSPRRVADRVVSTVEVDSRHAHKTRREHHDGYKAHIALEPSTGLVAGQKLTARNAREGPTDIELPPLAS